MPTIIWREKDLSSDVTVHCRIIHHFRSSATSWPRADTRSARDQLKAQFGKFVEDSSV
jgi:hypothetical protein